MSEVIYKKDDLIHKILNPIFIENSKLLDTFEGFTYEDYCKRKELWLRNFTTEWQIIGHITEENAKALVEECESSFAAYKKEVSHDIDLLVLSPSTVNEYCISHPNNKILNSTAMCYFQSDKPRTDFKAWGCNQLLFSMIQTRVHFVLRTKEQLGYITKAFPMNFHSILGGCILVHSPLKPVDYLIHRIHAFLDKFRLTDEKFEKYRSNAIANNQIKDHSLNETANRIWSEVFYQRYIFDRTEREIEALETLTFDDICDYWNSIIGAGSRRINIKVVAEAHKEGDPDAKELNSAWYRDNNLDVIQIDPEDIPSFMALHNLTAVKV